MRYLFGLFCVLALGLMGCSESAYFAYEECPGSPPLSFEPCRVDLSCSYTQCGGECCAIYQCGCSDGGHFSCSHVDDCGGAGGVGGGDSGGTGGVGGKHASASMAAQVMIDYDPGPVAPLRIVD